MADGCDCALLTLVGSEVRGLARHLRVSLLSEGDSGVGRSVEGGGVGVMRLKEGWMGVKGWDSGFVPGRGREGRGCLSEDAGVGVEEWEEPESEEERDSMPVGVTDIGVRAEVC